MLHEIDIICCFTFQQTFLNFYNNFVLFCLLIYLCLNKRTVKKQFYDKFSTLRELIYIWKSKILHYNILKTVAKSCEKILRCLRLKVEHVFNNKSESCKISFLNEMSYNKTVIDFNFGRYKDLSILKSDIHLSLASSVNYHFFWVDKS